MVTGRNITTVAKQVEKSTQDLDIDSLQVNSVRLLATMLKIAINKNCSVMCQLPLIMSY